MKAVDFFEEQEQQRKKLFALADKDLNGFLQKYAEDKGITQVQLINVIALGASYDWWGQSYSGDLYELLPKVDTNMFITIFEHLTKNNPNCFIETALKIHGYEFNPRSLIPHKSSAHRDTCFNKGIKHYSQDHKTLKKDKLALIMSGHINFVSKSRSVFTNINSFTYFEGHQTISACPNGGVIPSFAHGITYKLATKK